MNKQAFSFGDAIQVMFITAISYAVAYCYEYAYLKYFGVPSDFIVVDIKSIVTSAIGVIVLAYVGFQVIDAIARLIQMRFSDGNIPELFKDYGILFIFSLLLVCLSDMSIWLKIFMLTIPFTMLWMQIIFPLFLIRSHGSYKEAQSYFIKLTREDDFGFFSLIPISDAKKYLIVYVVSSYCIFAALVVGGLEASNKKDFLYDKKGFFVIRVYGGKAILGKGDKKPLETVMVKDINSIVLTRSNSID